MYIDIYEIHTDTEKTPQWVCVHHYITIKKVNLQFVELEVSAFQQIKLAQYMFFHLSVIFFFLSSLSQKQY